MESRIVKKIEFARSFPVLFFVSFVPLFFLSCASTGFEGKGTLVGRVCDMSGNAVSGYRLSFGANGKTVSGVNGVFYVNDIESGKLDMSGFASGWSSVNEKVDFFDRRSVLVVQVESEADVCRKISDALRFDDVDEAKRLLKKIERGNKNSPLFAFYEDLVEYRRLLADGKVARADSVKNRLNKRISLFEKSKNQNKNQKEK